MFKNIQSLHDYVKKITKQGVMMRLPKSISNGQMIMRLPKRTLRTQRQAVIIKWAISKP